MLVLSWAFSAPSAPFLPWNISHAWKGSLIFFFHSFCFSDCCWCSWDGEDKSHFIRLQHSGACKTWPIFLLLCLSCDFSGHWWTITGPNSIWGFFNVLESTGKPQCCSSVAFQSYQYLLSCCCPCCHLVRKLPSRARVCPLDLGVQLREASAGAEGHRAAQSAPNAPFQQANYYLSSFLLLPPKMAYFHMYQVFWGYQDVFIVLSYVLNAICINYY